jgi:hypothetical protein
MLQIKHETLQQTKLTMDASYNKHSLFNDGRQLAG